tara:strand:- start:1176 stop:2414 length:1239 start_codon:yes stop_codon:yes gene_type:complete
MRRYNYIYILLATILFLPALSQTKGELKDKKVALEQEIKFTSKLLNETKFKKDKSINYLKVLERQINTKHLLLENFSLEIKLLSRKLTLTKKEINNIVKLIDLKKKRLLVLRKEYSKMVYASFRNKSNKNDFMFIISSNDFNQAYKRLIYLKQYTAFRKNQSLKIFKSQEELEMEKVNLKIKEHELNIEKESVKDLRLQKQKELQSITISKKDKQDLVKKLSNSEFLFKKQLIQQQKFSKQLEEKIRKIIEEEMRKVRDVESEYRLTPESTFLSSEFKSNKGKLPWPLQNGVIVQNYGNQPHSFLPGIETFNNGIDIATQKNSIVRAVFKGKISRIFFISGQGKAVLINHGEYFSVYSGLSQVSVKVGEEVHPKEKIGVVLTQKVDKKTELHFEIWKSYDKYDPSEWLYKAY